MYIPIQDCCKHPLLRSWMLLIQLFYKFLRILSLGIAVNGTTACDNRKLILVPESDHICLLYKHDRTDHRQLHTIQITSGRKRVEASFKEEREQHSLYNIILVMRISNFVALHLFYRLIQSAFSHLGTQ